VVDASGTLHIEPRIKAAMAAFCRASLKNKPVDIILRKLVRHRTTPQLNYYWSTVIPEFAREEGYRTDEGYQLHDGLMHKFWPLEPDRVTKQPRRRRLTLKDKGCGDPLSDEEMGIHLEQTIMFAAERGIVISEADKAYREKRQMKAKAA
jgi:hypothetical protein